MDLRERFYLSPARTVFRRLQGVELLGRLRSGTATPDALPPSVGGEVEIRVGGVSATMVAEDGDEYRRLASYPEEVPLIEAILSLLRPGDCYWDIGASLGMYGLVAAQHVGADGVVVAFEPEPVSRGRLEHNVARNELDDRVRVLDVALGDRDGELTLSVAGHAASGAHSLIAAAHGPAIRDERVRVVRGDDVRAEHGLPAPTVAKIDVEGAELDVARGLVRTLQDDAVRGVLVEMHFAILDAAGRGDHPRRLVHLMDGLGFGTRDWIDKSHVLFRR